MAALYPLAYRAPWQRDTVVDAVSAIASAVGFVHSGSQPDTHESDADRTIDDIIRHHNVTNEAAIAHLRAQRPTLSECYPRLEHRWLLEADEIALVICDSNLIPFAAPNVRDSGDIWFACGFVDIAMPDRDIERLQLHDRMAKLPRLFASE